MRISTVTLVVMLALSLLSDAYIYYVLRRGCRSGVPAMTQLVTAVVLYTVAAVALLLPRRSGSDEMLLVIMWLLFGFLSVYLAKYCFVIFDLVASIPSLFKRRRLKWLTVIGAIVSVVGFVLMWWGALINRFDLQVKEVEVEVAGLPASFDGMRIVQFSDLHLGTYGGDTVFVGRMVDEINRLNPDIVFFTGDIVNRRSEEMLPFRNVLSRVHAPMGVFAILGNHDYGDYSEWATPEAKEANMQVLYDAFDSMGWHLLLNDYEMLHVGADSVALIGVENIGDPPFKRYGNLYESYPTLSDSVTKILLSHNPAHWYHEVKPAGDVNIALTLAGHTHAMQMEMFGITPARLRYVTPMGLYANNDSSKQLYVNIGVGTVGLPMRIGADPEITLITLKAAPHKSRLR